MKTVFKVGMEVWEELWLNTSRVLAFKSHEIAYNFLEEQKELLEKAKPLL